MSMNALYDLKELLCNELDEIARKQELSAGDLETVHKLADTVKNIDKICLMDETGEYSQAGDWEMEGRGTYGHSYANRRRDSMGRYARATSRMNGSRYSREGGKERMLEHLDKMLDEAGSEKEREAIRRCMSQMESV